MVPFFKLASDDDHVFLVPSDAHSSLRIKMGFLALAMGKHAILKPLVPAEIDTLSAEVELILVVPDG